MPAFPVDPMKARGYLIPTKEKVNFQQLQTLFLKKSFRIQIRDYLAFRRSWHGRVIVLIGASSAGKTTLIKTIKQTRGTMAEEGPDLTGAKFIYEFMEKNHKEAGVSDEDWLLMNTVLEERPGEERWHVHDAVAGLFRFKEGTSLEDQAKVEKAAFALSKPVDRFVRGIGRFIIDIVLDRALRHAQHGGDVIFDILEIEDVQKHPIARQTFFRSVLVYVPFNQISKRVNARNRRAVARNEFEDLRLDPSPFLDYLRLVRPLKKGDRERDVIDLVTKKSVEEALETTYVSNIECLKKIPDGEARINHLHENWPKERNKILKLLGFKKTDPPERVVKLVPHKHYDLSINTNQHDFLSIEARSNLSARRILGSFT